MEADIKTALREQTRGALEGLEQLDLGELDSPALVVALAAIGDALRLGIPLSPALAAQLQQSVATTAVVAAIESLVQSVRQWSLPLGPSADEDDPGLVWALRRRDEVESVRAAARRTLLPRGTLVDALPVSGALLGELAAHDLTCRGRIARGEAERMLADRLELVGERSWLDELQWADEGGSDGAEPLGVGDQAPSLDSLESYVVDGKLRRWIESAAARSEDVADELDDMIDTYLEHSTTGVSWNARLWQRARRKQTDRVVMLRPLSTQKRAAADASTKLAAEVIEQRLGVLDPLDAVATVVVTSTTVELRIHGGNIALEEVRLAGIAAPRPASGPWVVQVDRPEGEVALPISVVGDNGVAFGGSFRLAAAAL